MKPPFDTLVQLHGTDVLRVARAVVSAQDAEDAWSETFLSALEAYPRMPESTNWRGWLVTIAYRKAIDVHRRAGKAVTVADVPDSGADAPARDIDLHRALQRLPMRQRMAVVLHYIGGLPHAEIAAHLESTVPTARKTCSEGMRALRSLLAIDEPNGAA